MSLGMRTAALDYLRADDVVEIWSTSCVEIPDCCNLVRAEMGNCRAPSLTTEAVLTEKLVA